jgi:erythromycin esterase
VPDDRKQEAWREIETEYARLGAAVGNKDLDAIREIHAPEYRELQISGDERDLEEAMTAWKDDLDDMLEPNFQVAIDGVDLDRDEANVMARSTQTFVSSPFHSLRLGMRIETARRDCWINGAGGWRLTRSATQAMRSFVNDKLDEEISFEPPLTAQERASVVRDLGVHALAFKSVLAGNGFDDLAGLDGLIGKARIVALGEASHGTAEFFQMKHRLLEYLVERKGFTVFAIEGNWPEAKVADRFVKTGEGDAAAALAAMHFWTWQTEEVSALLEWMRAYNTRRGERPMLSFAGFDMQFVAVAISCVTDFLGRIGDADREAAHQLYDGVEKLENDSGMKIPPAEKTRLRDSAAKALELIDARRDELTKVSTPAEYRNARQAARIVCQASRMHAGISWAERDDAMAQNVRWLLEEGFPGKKIVLWAHNGHVGTAPIGGEKSLGIHLRDLYGDQLVVIGFASDHGEVRAKRVAEGKFQPGPPVSLPLAPALSTSVEALFQDAGLPRFILDLRRIPKGGALGRWLATPKSHRSIGSGYDPDRSSKSYVQVCLPEVYDAIIFIAESTAAKPLK